MRTRAVPEQKGSRRLPRILPAIVVVTAFVTAAGAAYAFLTVPASGSGQDQALTLVAPGTGHTSSATSSSLTLSWTDSSNLPTSGGTPDGYEVFRSTTSGSQGSEVTSGGCAAPVAQTTSTTSCTDSGLSANTTYYYEVEAVYDNWTSVADTQFSGTTSGVAPSFTSANHVAFATGTAGTFTVTTSGAPNVNSITNANFSGCTKTTTLPTGVAFTYTSGTTATITSTASSPAGTTTFCLNASNGVSPNATQTFTLTIESAPAITMNLPTAAGTSLIGNGEVLSAHVTAGTSTVASVSYYYCAGTSCTPATSIGSSTGGDDWPLSWTSQPANGSYQLDAVAIDTLGLTTTSAKVSVTVNNSSNLLATSQTIANGTGTGGKPETGDTIALTFNQAIQLSSVCSSWSNASQTVTGVTVTMANGNAGHGGVNSLSATGGTVASSSCGTLHVGGLSTASNAYDTNNETPTWASSTITWNAASDSLVITLGGTCSSCSNLNTITGDVTYTYVPDANIALASNASTKVQTGTTAQPTRTRENF